VIVLSIQHVVDCGVWSVQLFKPAVRAGSSASAVGSAAETLSAFGRALAPSGASSDWC